MAKEYQRQSSRNAQAYEALVPEAVNAPPQALELEEAVLGALMLESDTLYTVQEYLSEAAFYSEEHRLIYAAIDELSRELKPIDVYTVTDRLKSKRNLQKVGGAAYLAQLTQKVGTAANVEFHSRIIAQKYIQRELISTAVQIQQKAYDNALDVTELIGFAESEILKATEGHVKRAMQTSSDVLRRTIKQIEEASKNDSQYSGICTGFNQLDNMTLGWQPSDLIIVAARPAMGKTAFVLSMARNMAIDYNAPVAFFSLEMSASQLMMRLICGETGIKGDTIRSGKLTPNEWKVLETKTKPLGMAPIFIDDTPALSIFEFRSKARRLHKSKGLKIIIIDYLQLMTAAGQGDKGNREQEVSFISRTLKAVAKELDIPIIALSQLNRSTESRGGSRRPQLSDLRESGAIEQDADIVAFIHRPEYYGITETEDHMPTDGLAQIILAKHRNGAVGDVPLKFIKDQARFDNWESIDAMIHEQHEDIAATPYTNNNFSHTPQSGGGSTLAGMTGGDEFNAPSSSQDIAPF